MANSKTRHLRMGCGEALCSALVRQPAPRPASPPAPARSVKSSRTSPTSGRGR